MGKLFTTIGYGNMKPEAFLEKLKENKIDIIIDVRRRGTKSWCGKYNPGKPIRTFLEPIKYYHWYGLSNRFDTLDAYKQWIAHYREAIEFVCDLADMLRNSEGKFCLLCCEKEHLILTGRSAYLGNPNCHRVYVANALVNLLGEDWKVEHL